jgi:hypothetical protein
MSSTLFVALKNGDRFIMNTPETQCLSVFLKVKLLECSDGKAYNAVCLHTAIHYFIRDEMPVTPVLSVETTC